MRVLVTNDDGIFAQGLWALVKELKSIAEVVVVAPDREQSAIGTAVTLRQPLRVERVRPLVPEVEAYSVDGTPADSVILALGSKLLGDRIDMVVSGINQGSNLGDDVFISGTVSAARQGYIRGLPAIAVSVAANDGPNMDNAAKLAALLAEKISSNVLPRNMFLNVNVPDLPIAEIRGIEITSLASKSHINTVEEGNEGKQKCYWLVRKRGDGDVVEGTDIWAIEQGNISITPLHADLTKKPLSSIPESLGPDLLRELAV